MLRSSLQLIIRESSSVPMTNNIGRITGSPYLKPLGCGEKTTWTAVNEDWGGSWNNIARSSRAKWDGITDFICMIQSIIVYQNVFIYFFFLNNVFIYLSVLYFGQQIKDFM